MDKVKNLLKSVRTQNKFLKTKQQDLEHENIEISVLLAAYSSFLIDNGYGASRSETDEIVISHIENKQSDNRQLPLSFIKY